MKTDYDIIVIGSGVAGALTAWKLSQHGSYKILILEAGDNGISHGQRVQFHHMMDTQGSRGDPFAPYKDLMSRKFAPAAENSQRELDDQKNDANNYYDYPADQSAKTNDPFKASYNRMVGGSTWVWRGNTPRFLPSDFHLKKNFGVGRNWPLDYKELEPWYCEAEWELGVSGNHDELDGLFGAFRSKPFPMPGIPLSYSDQQIKAKIEGQTAGGAKIRVMTTPQARNSKLFDNRPACEGHSNCIPLCPIQAKYDATVHLRRLESNPNVKLVSGAVVTKLDQDTDKCVRTVHYIDWKSGPKPVDKTVTGAVIVLAAHAIETPKLLLMSNVANSSGHVGCNLMDHIQFELIASFPDPIFPFRGPQSITGIEAYRDGDFRKKRGAFRMTIGNDGWGRAGSPATIIGNLLKAGNYGSALPGLIKQQIPTMTRLSYSTEMLAEKTNRIELSDKTDALGIPRPRFVFDIGTYVQGALSEGFDTATAIFGLMGATVINPQPKPKVNPDTGRMNWNTAAHIMGTTIMGDDPKDSVVNRFGRSHDVPNLWIAGSSVFATSATSNPTLTIAALALRMAHEMHRTMK